MRKYRLKKDHRFIKDSSRNPDFEYTIFEKGEVITEIPYAELAYGEKKAIRDEKARGKIFIWAYDPKNIKRRFWRTEHLERIKAQVKQFAPTPKRKK